MPRIDDRFLDCSIYLYRDEKDAKSAKRAGGSGFLFALSADGDGWLARGSCPDNRLVHVYAVSNRHVVSGHGDRRLNPGAPIVRLNTHAGATDVLPLTWDDWSFSVEHDLAVCELNIFGPQYKYLSVGDGTVVTKRQMAASDIGLGDEVFMVGRFVNHEGVQRNSPSMRFGHIAMMPFEPVSHPSNESGHQESFLVEIHSNPGYSGSPVFVRPFETKGIRLREPGLEGMVLAGGPWLLGVEWGYLHNHDQRQNNTGMSGVVPAWHLLDLLNTEKLREQRRASQEKYLEHQEQGGSTLTQPS